MRLLTLCCEYPPIGGGGATACEVLAEALASRGHEVDVVTSGDRGLLWREERRGVRIHRATCLRRSRHYSTAPELATWLAPAYQTALRLHRAHRYDLVHCHFVVPSGIIAWLLARRTGLPYVLTAHGSDVPGFNPERFNYLHHLVRPFWTRIIRSAACLTAPSNYLEGLIREQIDVRVEILRNPCRPFPSGMKEPGERILVVARLVERKGIQHLLTALSGLDTHWECWIAGDGPCRSALEKAAPGWPRVRFLGMVPREELRALYRSARVFVLPSLQENFPMVLLEAMAAGCAIVTTSIPGSVEVVGDASLLVEPGDGEALHRALANLLANDALVDDLRRRSRARAALFDAAHIATQFEALFDRAQAG